MPLTKTLKDDALFRAAAEQKALHLESMTAAEIASLSDERLKSLHHRASMARWQEECDGTAYVATDPHFARMERYRELENKASVEIAARGKRRAA